MIIIASSKDDVLILVYTDCSYKCVKLNIPRSSQHARMEASCKRRVRHQTDFATIKKKFTLAKASNYDKLCVQEVLSNFHSILTI